MSTISRQNAIAQGLPRYFTGEPCKHGHTAARYTANKTCVTCANAKADESKAKNPEKYTALVAAWQKANPEKRLSYTRKYAQKNRDKRNLWTANYRQTKIDRMPQWLAPSHIAEMESVYAYCAALNACGLKYHVDHVVPLRGKQVSGLHVPWNLQVIPGTENMSKGNNFHV